MKPKGFIMYEDFNEQDFALNAAILPIAQNDKNKQFGLNVAADLIKFIFQTYISNKKISTNYYLYDNIVWIIRQYVLLLQEPTIKQKVSSFIHMPSIKCAQDVVNVLPLMKSSAINQKSCMILSLVSHMKNQDMFLRVTDVLVYHSVILPETGGNK